MKERIQVTFWAGLITILITIALIPILIFWIGYFGGWITKILIGKFLVEAFGIFGINFSIDKLPLVTGFVAWICSYLKPSSVTAEK